MLASFDQSPEALAIATLDGTCVRANQAWCALLGRPATGLVDRPLFEHAAPEDGRAIRERCSHLRELRHVNAEVRLARPDGRLVAVDVGLQCVERPGLPTHFIANARETGVERWAASHRQRLSEEAQRSQQLRSLVRMGGGIAHEFNNMLAIIVNYAEFAGRRRPGDPRLRGDLDQIERAAMRCASLTRQLMIFTRCDHVEPETLEVDAVVGDTVALLARDREDVILVLDLGAPGLTVELPPSHAEQLLAQLVANASEAMVGGGRLIVRTSRTRERFGGRRRPAVRLELEDSGRGMTPEEQASAFEPFWTSHPDGTHAGLGLTLAQGIVERAGGRIEITSEHGLGTRVTVLLPATDGEDAPALTDELPGPPGRGERVLVVDDEVALRQLVANVLADAGYDAIGVGAEEALARYREAPVQLLVADVVMPVVSGPRLATELRQLDPTLPILFVSGYTEERLARSALPPRTWRFLAKPFDRGDLLRAVRETLDTPVGS